MQNRTTLGVLCLCLGILVFSLQDAAIKFVSDRYPLTEVLAGRCLVSAPVLLVMVHFESGLSSLVSKQFWPLLIRGLIMFAAYTTYYMAFPALPLADAVALFFTVPLFMVALAALLLGEPIGWQRIGAVAVGFAGVIVMLRPGAGLFEPAALLSLVSAATYALAMIMARRLGVTEPATVMAFHQNWAYLAGALAIAGVVEVGGLHSASHPSIEFIVRPWAWPTPKDLLLIGSCGIIAAIGMTLLTNAYRIARASIVASFEYTGMLWAPLWGLLFFGEVPEITTFVGAGMIVVAGLIALSVPKAEPAVAT